MIALLLKWIIGDMAEVAVQLRILAQAVKDFVQVCCGWVRPVHVDGALYVSIALFAFQEAFISSENIYKYVNPYLIFYAQWFFGSLAAAAGAMKMFRSNSYAEHLKEKASGNTQFIRRTDVDNSTQTPKQ